MKILEAITNFMDFHGSMTILAISIAIPVLHLLLPSLLQWDSWDKCTTPVSPYNDDYWYKCDGCTISKQAAATFPMFAALLNAVHQKAAKVRILTNNYETPTCGEWIAPLDWLALNGIEVRYYRTTTFMHTKYVAVNGKKASVSSVNFSHTSFMQNREAGMIVSGNGSDQIRQFYQTVFNGDWEIAIPYTVNNTYAYSDWQTITSTNPYTVTVPPQPVISGAYVTPQPADITETMTATAWASPDSGLSEMMSDLNAATTSFELYVYQVTDTTLCQKLQDLHANGIQVTLLVSSNIVSSSDKSSAAACYQQLYNAGLTAQMTASYYTYSHQKYWVVDGKTVSLSSGNWSPTDSPAPPSDGYVPYGKDGWSATNRDFNLRVNSSQVVSVFQTTFSQDLKRATPYMPGWAQA